ncbi:hypothetical protein B0H14DRAFT_2894417 [Mycena olivaceomarginata]|nr:hypothetical protein B0H14DRAFT_3058549 [Mycena olivaceomarginata]KAJ7801847.1 hypothetical protein B0H14DRAFT_2894417 [Mycena olivaceomarginata]
MYGCSDVVCEFDLLFVYIQTLSVSQINKADMAADTRIRRIGLLERYHATRNFLGLDSCVVASAKYSTEDRRPLTKDILFLLSGRLHTIDLSRIVQFRDNDSLWDSLESQLAEGFDTDADLPLWRIQVLGDNTVIFAIYHIIGDGLSTIAFHASLLRALRDVPAGDASPLVQTPNTDVTSVRPSLSTIFDEVYRLDRTAWSGKPVPMGVNGSLRTNVRLMSFPAQEVTAFCTMCQTHRTTVTAAFYVLTVATLSRMLAGDPRYDAISSTVAISLRGAAGIPKDAICDYKSKARENIGMLSLGKKRASGFVLSNLGRFDAPAVEGTWNIVNTVFAQCDVVVGAAFKMNVVCDPTGL